MGPPGSDGWFRASGSGFRRTAAESSLPPEPGTWNPEPLPLSWRAHSSVSGFSRVFSGKVTGPPTRWLSKQAAIISTAVRAAWTLE